MSQNKTIIPGFDNATAHNDGMGGFYNRSASAVDRSRTYIPDIYRSAAEEIAEEQTSRADTELKLQDRTIVGALFSISRCSIGEVFPIYIGRNTIGSSEESDVCLLEETVSQNHAVLLVRAIEGTDGKRDLKVYMTDYDSEFGTKVGDTALEYDKIECHDHDIISVGCNYKFLLCLFDAERYGLKVNREFCPIQRQQPENCDNNIRIDIPIQRPKAQPIIPTTIGESDEAAFYGRTKEQDSDHTANKTVIL